MTRIGLISDTHGYLDAKVFTYFQECDEIWHAGDIGSTDVIQQLSNFKKFRGVYGNIDGQAIRKLCPLDQKFTLEGINVWMTHIGGYPGRYEKRVWIGLQHQKFDLFISGHSHILKVMRDKKHHNLLHINPGAAGKQGFHKIKTLIRFTLNREEIKNLEAIELGPK